MKNVLVIFGLFLGWSSARADFKFHEIQNLKNPDRFECLFLGDLYYGEVYQEKYKQKGDFALDLSQESGYDQAAINLRQILGDSDLNIANLASPITNMIESPLAIQNKEYLHKGDVIKTPAALLRHQINVVSLANNHLLDYGIQGLTQTQELLKRSGISHFGSGENLNQAMQPYLFKVPLKGGKEFKVAVIGALEERDSYKTQRFDFYASKFRNGVAPLREKRIEKLVKELRAFDKDIFIILFPHWGRDYEKVTATQQALAESWIQIGVNVVIGHGSHTAHPVRVEGNQLLAFSIGNSIFNSIGRFEKRYTNAYSMIVRLIKKSDKDTVAFRFYPTFNDNTEVKFSPRFVKHAEFAHVLDDVKTDETSKKKIGRDQYGWFFEYEISEYLN